MHSHVQHSERFTVNEDVYSIYTTYYVCTYQNVVNGMSYMNEEEALLVVNSIFLLRAGESTGNVQPASTPP